MDITLRMSDHALTARAAAAAGIVLLQNKNRTLPLLPQEDGAPLPVAVFGVKQLQTPAFDKTMTPWRSIGVLDGLAASETVRPDALLARKYRTWAVEHPVALALILWHRHPPLQHVLLGHHRQVAHIAELRGSHFAGEVGDDLGLPVVAAVDHEGHGGLGDVGHEAACDVVGLGDGDSDGPAAKLLVLVDLRVADRLGLKGLGTV